MRRELVVEGIVQGVGFRPYVYHLAQVHRLAGWVCNDERGVAIAVEGAPDAVAAFEADLRERPPALAVVTRVVGRDAPPCGEQGFRIVASQRGEERAATVPADAATCADCRADILDPANRRYRYPFTNCTNCGPRFTIIKDIPYDRPATTMASFAMCPACAREYHDPADRRFHAQPNACPACGPSVRLVDASGRDLCAPEAWLAEAAARLRSGQILAVKGIGAFHLACDACDEEAVARLRRVKHRRHRPFALMARDLETVRRVARVSPAEEQTLASPAAPIVLLQRLAEPALAVAPSVAPGVDTLGIMLPYTPLHILLLQEAPPLLVMTSGNPSGLPVQYREEEALADLSRLADAFLIHNRPIHVPCDDSVVQVVDGEVRFLRRSRGYVPREVVVPVPPSAGAGQARPAVLGAGGDLKNTFCLLQGRRAVLSQHLGDLETEEGQANYLRALDHLRRLTGIRPSVVACDMHPGYRSASLARTLEAEAVVPVQHHHAHMAACMAENGWEGDAIGLVLDGTGYGADGAIWGFEVLTGGFEGFRRVAHLAYSPLPGSEAAVRRPVRAAAGMLWAHLGSEALERLAALHPARAGEIQNARRLLEAGINCPPAGTAGRLFDGVAAILGICPEPTYEGQAAIELGAAAERAPDGCYPFRLEGGEILPGPLLEAVLADALAGVPAPRVAGRFLATVVAILVEAACRAREETGLRAVCLSGGTFNSPWLLHHAARRLAERGFRVLRHRLVPPGDGGIALGQAVIAQRRWRGCV
ncbi:hydrogenase maturation protein HypF [Symbiobacterium terraclitae]|uniref:Carbamoyltransferase n=1 Tax=Symbiobacterium terraclitae TaxID=557451 RepID=A0ABS4JTN4_9FIRM|nr:hydrogenase maturation protein HypF [Symbiobacterium terraclitae]